VFNTPEQMISYTDSHRGQVMTLQVKRGDKTFDVQLTPRVSPPPGQGAMGIGIYPAPEKTEITHYSWYEALGKGLEQAWTTLKLTVQLPGELLRGAISPELARPVGPVGIIEITGSAAAQGVQTGWWQPLLQLVAAISLALGFTNLLPLPALDGGKLLFLAVELVRGKRVDPAKENLVHWIGLLALVSLMLVITYLDITSPPPNIQLPSPF
jgi:regulator of sigma E protease